jgi:hypothetical protein
MHRGAVVSDATQTLQHRHIGERRRSRATEQVQVLTGALVAGIMLCSANWPGQNPATFHAISVR